MAGKQDMSEIVRHLRLSLNRTRKEYPLAVLAPDEAMRAG
jgi:hypothetical protein